MGSFGATGPTVHNPLRLPPGHSTAPVHIARPATRPAPPTQHERRAPASTALTRRSSTGAGPRARPPRRRTGPPPPARQTRRGRRPRAPYPCPRPAPRPWAALLELVGADRDACLVVPLGADLPSIAGAALPLDRIHEFAARAAAARRVSWVGC